jgi:hypothetical protein
VIYDYLRLEIDEQQSGDVRVSQRDVKSRLRLRRGTNAKVIAKPTGAISAAAAIHFRSKG